MKTDNRQAIIHLAHDALVFADQINTDWPAEKQLTHLREQIALARKHLESEPDDAMKQVQAQNEAFKAFTDAMLDISWQGDDVDGSDIQDFALKLGLLKEVVKTERCSDERCICAEVTDFPATCNRKTYLSKEGQSCSEK